MDLKLLFFFFFFFSQKVGRSSRCKDHLYLYRYFLFFFFAVEYASQKASKFSSLIFFLIFWINTFLFSNTQF